MVEYTIRIHFDAKDKTAAMAALTSAIAHLWAERGLTVEVATVEEYDG